MNRSSDEVLSFRAGATVISDASDEDRTQHDHAQALESILSARDVELPTADGISSFDVALVNVQTGSNVVFRGLPPSMGRLRLTRRLLAECCSAGLGSTTRYECRVMGLDTGGVTRVSRVQSLAGRPNVRLPRLRYRQNGRSHDVKPGERKLESVSLDVPEPIFAPDADAETRKRIGHAFYTNALARGAYRYDYRLPNGDLTSVVEDAEDADDEEEAVSHAMDSSVIEGNFELEEWVDGGNGIIAPSASAMKAVRASCQAWDAALYVSHPVRVRVGFKSLAPKVLGSSYRPSSYYDSKTGWVYPAALIDQMTGEDMHPDVADIRVVYSTSYSFYYGTDGACPSAKHDFLSIVTHEICHGLAFTSYHYRGWDGDTPDGTWAKEAPGIFDSFLYYGGSRWPKLSVSQRLKSMTSGALYWDGTNAKAANGGARIPMYSPNPYNGGSSVSHWADGVTKAPLMKHSIAAGTVTHGLDKILLGAFKDMGWPMASDRPTVSVFEVTYRPGAYGSGTVVSKKSTGSTVTLESALFSRTGYIQTGWSLTDGGALKYALGATCTLTGNITLYPYWSSTPTTYLVTYRPGAYGTGDVQIRTKVAKATLTLEGALYTRSGYAQTGWSLVDGGSKSYALKGTYSTDANVTLYPYWQSLATSDFEYELDGGSVRITGYKGSATAVPIPTTINGYPVREIGYEAFLFADVVSVTVPEGVTTVDSFAFGFCDKLQSVSLPSTVTRIGGYASNTGSYEAYSGAAFIRSPSLKSISVASGNAVYCSVGGVLYNKSKTHLVNYPAALNGGSVFGVPSTVKAISAFAFYGAKTTGVTLPAGLQKVESYAFENSAVTSMDLPSTVTSVGTDVFLGCSSLKKLVLRSSFTSSDVSDKWGSGLANDQIWVDAACYAYWTSVFGNGVRKIADAGSENADFEYSTDGGEVTITGYKGTARDVTVPATLGGLPVRTIAKKVFMGTDVASVRVSEGVTTVDSFAFSYAPRLTSVSLPSTVTTIGGYAFTSATFESYSGAAFMSAPALTRIDVAAGNQVYSSSGGILYNRAKTHLVNYPTALNAGGKFVIPKQVVEVSAFAFEGAKLKSVALSESMTTAGMFSFENSDTLEEVMLPSALTVIEMDAFANCTALKRIAFPEGLEEIGMEAFSGCGLTSVDLPASIVAVDETAFAFCTDIEKIVLRSAFDTEDASDKWGSNVENDQIWVAADCYAYWTGVLGKGLNRLDEGSGTTECVLTLSCGWTWFSVPVTPTDASFASVFKGVSFANDDIIKSSDGSATYYGGTWYPSPMTFKLVPGRAYAVKKSTAGTTTVKVSGAAAPTSLAVAAGWNWIGPLSNAAVPLSSLTHSGGFANDDVINSSSGSATYYGGTWYGDLRALAPGVGYKAKFGKAGKVSH